MSFYVIQIARNLLTSHDQRLVMHIVGRPGSRYGPVEGDVSSGYVITRSSMKEVVIVAVQ